MNKKGDLRRNDYLIVFIVVVVLAGIFICGKLYSISTGIKESGQLVQQNTEKINEAVGKLNTNLGAIEKIPSQVDSIQTEVNLVKDKIDLINSDTSLLRDTEANLKSDVSKLNEQITSLTTQIDNFNKNIILLKELQEKYPPVQTQQLIFENVSNQEVNQAIQTAINSNSRNFGIYFGFGSVFGISIIYGLQIYFKKKREEER